MNAITDNPTYTRGQDAARQAIERSVSLEEYPTEQAAAKHYLAYATHYEEPGHWRNGFISYCEEIADQ